MKRVLKVIFWTVMSLALIVIGSLLATVRLLKPERLTPLVQTTANRMLNADVSVDRVQLLVNKSFPFLNVEVDNLTILSRDMRQLPSAVRDTLPTWSDSLCSVESLKAGINLLQLAKGAIHLSDVEISGLSANALIVNDSLNNFDIYHSTSAPDTTKAAVPDFSVNRFRIVNPKPIRYADLSTGMRLQARIDTAAMQSNQENIPAYRINIDTNLQSPLLDMLNNHQANLSVDGTINWNHQYPDELELSDFIIQAEALKAQVNTKLDFSNQLMAKSLDLAIGPLNFNRTMAMLPDSVAESYGIPTDIDTNAELSLQFVLQQPYDLTSGAIPYGQASLELPKSYLKWKQIDLREMELDLDIFLAGNDLDAASAHIKKLLIAGPATTIQLNGRVSDPISDPLFDGNINGHVILGRLPAQLTALLGGVHPKGTITLDTHICGRKSMLSRNGFHLLKVNGDMVAKGIRYISPDTLTMLYVNNADFKFGTNRSFNTSRGMVDSLLTASIAVDTASLDLSDMDIRIKNLKVGAGALNTWNKRDTTAIIPFGGRLAFDMLTFLSPADSTIMRVRKLNGSLALLRYEGDAHLPLLRLNAELGRISAGDKTTRFMVNKADFKAQMHKLPLNQMSKSRQAFNRLADSLHKAMPTLPPDSIYDRAMQIRRANMAKRNPNSQRKQSANADSTEVIDWGVNSGMKRLLLDWNISGSFTAKRARLFTTAFPIRNRLSNLDLHFNNDSVVLQKIEYEAGHSDFLISGHISNMKKAFTSRRPQNIEINFDLISDTIDVNELANAFFTGAANRGLELTGDLDDENNLELKTNEVGDSTGPFLIPVNIDARFNIKADNVLYSDFLLHNLRGEALAYDGALNLHGLHAASNVGTIDLSALYSAPNQKNMKFGFGMQLKDFNIRNFLQLVPAVDSLMPLMRDMGGIIKANIAATADVDQEMNLIIPSLNAAISLEGDSLVLLDPETFKTISKWLLFKDKNNNLIDHMSVQLIVENNVMQLYPFVFDFDRYRLGVQGKNDLEMNFDYHVAVLKSPLPFKFGINVKGNTDKYKIRLGRAHFNEKQAVSEVALVDTTRINLINQFENVFRRGVRNSKFAQIEMNQRPATPNIELSTDTLTAADSLYLRQQGLLE